MVKFGFIGEPCTPEISTTATPRTVQDRACCSALWYPDEDRSLPRGWQSERHRNFSWAHASPRSVLSHRGCGFIRLLTLRGDSYV